MEISTGADPYEQQLLAVFESCDRAGTGRLDSEGLAILCQKLHLQEGHDQLKGCLLRSSSGAKAVFTFSEFRDALLALLGADRRQTEDDEDEREQSPDREVSPKFVFGQKKYGRRSRPESTDQEGGGQDTIIDDADCDTFLPPVTDEKDYKMKCSSILEEEHKLRRSTVSTPDSVASIILDKDEIESSHGQGEAELRAAWKKLGVGSDGFLDKLELAMVCRAVGMEKVAEEVVNQVFSKLDVDSKGRISFEEFLQLFRSGTPQSPSHPVVSSPPPQPFQSSHLASLDINSTGYVSTDSIIELWEMAGVVGASGLLHDLRLAGSTEINITLLASVLDEEIRNIRQDTKVHKNCSSRVALLTAALALAHVQIKCSKSSLEQMIGEREKLRNDLAEANERASLLAQEVDDRHARMEKASQMQIKVMEQRHADQLKQLSLQLTADREQLTTSTQRLEKKLAQQQEEESRIRADLATLQMEYEGLEKDNRSLTDRLTECEELKTKAEKEIQRMEKLQQRVSELEGSSDQVASLIESLTQLQAENASLRDRNDELTIQVETLSSRVSNRKQGSSISLEGCLGGGTKRRGNSPLALPPDENWDDDSPRMGKVRRCCTENDLSLDNVHMEGLAIRPLRHSESGLEADLDTLDDSLTLSSSSVDKVNFKVGSDSDNNGGLIAEVEKLRSYIAELERANEQYQMKLAVSDCQYSISDEDDYVNTRGKIKSELKQVFSVIRKQVMDELSGQFDDVDSRAEDETVVSNPQMEPVEMEIQTSLENSDDITELKTECNRLKMTLTQIQKELIKITANKKICTNEDCILRHHLENVIVKLPYSMVVNGDVNDTIMWESDINILPNSQNSYEKIVLKNSNQINVMNGVENEMDSTLNVFVKQIGSMQFENLSQFAFELSESLNSSNFVNDNNTGNKPCGECLDALSKNNTKNTNMNNTVGAGNGSTDFKVNNAVQESHEKCLNNVSEINSLIEENKKLHDKCTELETALEMMRIEYEKCEDYWQDKLNEERAIFEQEQKISDEKFADLQIKIQEYAEMFDNEDRKQDCRLPTIDERGSLEKQVTDLEEEFEEFRKAAETEAEERLKEVLRLRAELNSLERSNTSYHMVTGKQDVGIQADQEIPTDQMSPAVPDTNISITAAVDVSPTDSIECCCACHQSTVQAARRGIARLRENKHRLQSECDVLTQRRELILRQLSELQHRTNLIYSTAQERRPSIDVQLFHNLSSRLRHQELRCRHLQSALKHQHRQTEKILQNAWEQHQTDLTSVQNTLRITQEKLQQQTMASKKQMERLAVSDVLVKDLYVENTHLAATLQKLEQRCHFLSERATVASSV